MADTERAVKGLECCIQENQDHRTCPYNMISHKECSRQLMKDALQQIYRQTEADRLLEAVEQVKAGRVRRYIGDGFEVIRHDAD